MNEREEYVVRLFFLGVFGILLIVYFLFTFKWVAMPPKCKDNLIDKPRDNKKDRAEEKRTKDTIYVVVVSEYAQTRHVNY